MDLSMAGSYSQKGDTTIYGIYTVLFLQGKFGLAVFRNLIFDWFVVYKMNLLNHQPR